MQGDQGGDETEDFAAHGVEAAALGPKFLVGRFMVLLVNKEKFQGSKSMPSEIGVVIVLRLSYLFSSFGIGHTSRFVMNDIIGQHHL